MEAEEAARRRLINCWGKIPNIFIPKLGVGLSVLGPRMLVSIVIHTYHLVRGPEADWKAKSTKIRINFPDFQFAWSADKASLGLLRCVLWERQKQWVNNMQMEIYLDSVQIGSFSAQEQSPRNPTFRTLHSCTISYACPVFSHYPQPRTALLSGHWYQIRLGEIRISLTQIKSANIVILFLNSRNEYSMQRAPQNQYGCPLGGRRTDGRA